MTEMRDVDHTHPHTDAAFGSVFERGRLVADGGEHGDAERDSVSALAHDAPEGVTRAFGRGTEEREDGV